MRAPLGRPLSVAALASVSLLAGACADVPMSPEQRASLSTASTASGAKRHLIVAKKGTPFDVVVAAVRAAGGTVMRVHAPTGLVVAKGLSPAAVRTLEARTDVRNLAADVSAYMLPPHRLVVSERQLRGTAGRVPTGVQADQSGAAGFSLQWHLRQIRAPEAWRATNSGNGTLVCILDTGIDPGHPDLAGKVDLDKSTSFVLDEPFIEDLNAHGTAVASIVSTNGIVLASVAPNARLCAVKVNGENGMGSFLDLAFGILHAADEGADVINMSLGALVPRYHPDITDLIEVFEELIISYARDKGALLVAAAGNESTDLAQNRRLVVLPAGFRGVVRVAATGPVNQRDFYRAASYSNVGFRGVDIYAPGGEYIDDEVSVIDDLILGACSRFTTNPALAPCREGPRYLYANGTSISSPVAAGIAAIVEGKQRGNTDGIVLRACLLAGTDRMPDTPETYAPHLPRHANSLGSARCQRVGFGFPLTGPESSAAN